MFNVHRLRRVTALTAAVLLSFLFQYCATHAQSYIDRSASCVAVLKRLNPTTHIQDGLTDAKCPLATPVSAYSGTARHPWLASGAACETDLQEVPACGLTKNLLDALPGAVRRITLGGGKCLHVLPVMLTDKTSGFKCNAVKARPACVSGIRQEGGATGQSRTQHSAARQVDVGPVDGAHSR
jgi:hypothetical protein